MLVLSRKTGEAIHIGEGITVQVIETRGNRVRLGIPAPEEVAILRGEIADYREQWQDCPAPLPKRNSNWFLPDVLRPSRITPNGAVFSAAPCCLGVVLGEVELLARHQGVSQ